VSRLVLCRRVIALSSVKEGKGKGLFVYLDLTRVSHLSYISAIKSIAIETRYESRSDQVPHPKTLLSATGITRQFPPSPSVTSILDYRPGKPLINRHIDQRQWRSELPYESDSHTTLPPTGGGSSRPPVESWSFTT
jgi:hypothetical protein